MSNALIRELTMGCAGDDYGWAMGCWFAIADRIHHDLDELCPDHWEHTAGMGGPDTDSYEYELAQSYDLDELIETGNILYRYVKYLKYKGLDY